MTIQRPIPNKGRHIQLHRRATDKINYDREKPTFCLRFIDPSYCITRCNQEEQSAFVDTLVRMSKMTWMELRGAHRHGLGSEKIDRAAIKRPIPPHITEDVAFLAFRFSGMKPMVGYRMQGMFHVVWFDRDFTLYNHE
jgi:hypothetical protein